jgi:hypothetical protein
MDGFATIVRFTSEELGILLSEELQSLYTQRNILSDSNLEKLGYDLLETSEIPLIVEESEISSQDIIRTNSTTNLKKRRIEPILLKPL